MKIINDPLFSEKELLTRIARNINKELIPHSVKAVTIIITGMNGSFSRDVVKTAVDESKIPFFELEMPETSTLVLQVYGHKTSLSDFLKK